MKIKYYIYTILIPVLFTLTSCLEDNPYDKDYSEWRARNEAFIKEAENVMENGQLKYKKLIPDWDKSVFALVQWHKTDVNSTSLLTPISNSTIDVKYVLLNIDGDTIDSSFKQTANGDSIFRCRPFNMISGFQVAVTNMHVGDSVTAVIPAASGYGASSSGRVLPYSTLIFGIKLDSIVAYESLPWRE